MLPIPVSYGLPALADVVGSYKIPATEFKATLGDNAFLLWRKLQWCRAIDGMTHVTYRTLQNFRTRSPYGKVVEWQKQTSKQIEKGFARLRKAHLVRNERYVRSKNANAVIMRRFVFGAFINPQTVAVPAHSYAPVKSLCGHGGARKGAGRKPRVITYEKNQEGNVRGIFSRGGHSRLIKGRGSNTLSEGMKQKKQVSSVCPPTSGTALFSFREKHVEGIGIVFGSPNKDRKIRFDQSRVFAKGVPRKPTAAVVYAPKVPRPKEVRENLTDVQKVRLVAEAYAAVTKHFTRTKDQPNGAKWWGPGGARNNWRDNPEVLRKWKFWNCALESADVMAEKNIRPVEWARWCAEYRVGDDWQKRRGVKKTVMPFGVMFSPKTIRKRSGWFRKAQDPLGGRALPGEKFKDLMRRFGWMETALRSSTGPVADVVDKYFPNDLHVHLTREAQEETQAKEQELAWAAMQGEWIWS